MTPGGLWLDRSSVFPPCTGECEKRLLDMSEFWEGLVRVTGSERQEVLDTDPAMEEDLGMGSGRGSSGSL